jgi:acyl carrier protein
MPAETQMNNAPMTRNNVLDLVKDRLADILEIEVDTISESQSFSDLKADSLALIELVDALERELSDRITGFHIADEDLEDLRGVRDTVDYLYDRVK